MVPMRVVVMVRFCTNCAQKYLGAPGVLWHSSCESGLLRRKVLLPSDRLGALYPSPSCVPSRFSFSQPSPKTVTEPRPSGSVSLLQHRIERALPIPFQIDGDVVKAQRLKNLNEGLRHLRSKGFVQLVFGYLDADQFPMETYPELPKPE